jgi:hypothetical protein
LAHPELAISFTSHLASKPLFIRVATVGEWFGINVFNVNAAAAAAATVTVAVALAVAVAVTLPVASGYPAADSAAASAAAGPGGPVVTRLQHVPHLAAPSARQAPLVVGWAELEQLLLQYLPPETVQWECIAASYTDRPAVNEVTLQVVKAAQEQLAVDQGRMVEDDHHHQQQQQDKQRPPGQAAAAGDPSISPFTIMSGSKTTAAAAPQTDSADTDEANSVGTGGAEQTPYDAANESAARETHLQVAGSLNWQPSVAAGGSNGTISSSHVPLQCMQVRARLLLATDGALSVLRQQCVGDGLPAYDVSGRATSIKGW